MSISDYFKKLSAKKKLDLGMGAGLAVLLIATVAILYSQGKLGMKADVIQELECPPGYICNQAGVDYLDAQGNPQHVDSNQNNVALASNLVDYEFTLNTSKWYLLSLPGNVVGVDGGEPTTIFNGIALDGRLYGWDNPTQSQTMYDEWIPELFGKIKNNTGYWLNLADSDLGKTISYQAEELTSPQTISLPKAGWSIIGNPFNQTIPIDGGKIYVIKNGERKTFCEAGQPDVGWISATMYWWNNQGQSLFNAGCPDDFPQSEEIQPWHGYWLRLYQDDLTLEFNK